MTKLDSALLLSIMHELFIAEMYLPFSKLYQGTPSHVSPCTTITISFLVSEGTHHSYSPPSEISAGPLVPAGTAPVWSAVLLLCSTAQGILPHPQAEHVLSTTCSGFCQCRQKGCSVITHRFTKIAKGKLLHSSSFSNVNLVMLSLWKIRRPELQPRIYYEQFLKKN